MKAVVFLLACAALVAAQESTSIWDGVYTEPQAKRGADLFDRECAQCHGPAGAGGSMAPALVGPAFTANYDGQTVGDLFDRNRATMPVGKEREAERAAGRRHHRVHAASEQLPSRRIGACGAVDGPEGHHVHCAKAGRTPAVGRVLWTRLREAGRKGRTLREISPVRALVSAAAAASRLPPAFSCSAARA